MSKLDEKVEALLQAAVVLETEAQRADYLNRACPDLELRREVESLLAAHDHPDALLATHPEPPRPNFKLDLAEAQFDVADVARHFPQLEILEWHGQGGMGVVNKARQPQLDRLVALKIMLPEFAKDHQPHNRNIPLPSAESPANDGSVSSDAQTHERYRFVTAARREP